MVIRRTMMIMKITIMMVVMITPMDGSEHCNLNTCSEFNLFGL